MPTSPPVLVLIDHSALMGSTSREWQEYSRIGTCYIPQVIYEEIKFLTDRATEGEVEKTAREFMRFFPNSGWQLTDAHATHPTITPPGGSNLSKQARLVVTVAQCGYGFALDRTDSLVVFVSNTQAILQRIPALGIPNFCGVTKAAFLQWVRTGQVPPAVSAQIETFNSSGQVSAKYQAPAVEERQMSAPPTPNSTITGPASAIVSASTSSKSRSVGTGLFPRLINAMVALVVIAAVGLVAWRFIQPASFDRFWKQMNLPALPGQQPAQPSKPVKK